MTPGPEPYAGVGALGPIWGGVLWALGPIWGGASGRPKADIMEAEGRLNGGLGAKPPGIWGPWALLGALAAIPIGGVIGSKTWAVPPSLFAADRLLCFCCELIFPQHGE